MITIKLLGPGDAHVLRRVAAGVFDNPVDAGLASEFLNDPRHHLIVAMGQDGEVVGMASAVHYVHPDKRAQLFINEVGMSPAHERQGTATLLVSALLARGRELGCTEAWVATDPDNHAAHGLYEKAGGLRATLPSILFTFPLPDESTRDSGNAVTEFTTTRIAESEAEVAPDGSEVRPLLGLRGGAMAVFELAPGQTSTAVKHRTVEEIWLFVEGRGEMWRQQEGREEIVPVEPGVCLTIPVGTHFQFRCTGNETLRAVGVTMPPWPSEAEAANVEGKWTSALGTRAS